MEVVDTIELEDLNYIVGEPTLRHLFVSFHEYNNVVVVDSFVELLEQSSLVYFFGFWLKIRV